MKGEKNIKIRKKKEKEKEKYDILQLNEKIKNLIISEEKKITNYEERLNFLSYELNKNSESINYIDYKTQKDYEEEFKVLTTKIENIKTNSSLIEYLCLTENIIIEYNKLLNIPIKVNFFGKKEEEDDKINIKKNFLLQQYLNIAKKYIPIKIHNVTEINNKTECECGSIEFEETDSSITCIKCGIEYNINGIYTYFKDIERVNLSQKYKYSRRIYFKDTINRYEGKQNKKIPQKVYDDIDKWFSKNNLLTKNVNYYERHSKITKEQLYMALSETGNNLYYEDKNLLYNHFTGKPCIEINNEIKDEIFKDFDKILEIYETLNVDRINFLSGQYILYQLLRKRKVDINEEDFDILETKEKLIDYDDIYKKICEKLDWEFNPTI